MVWFTVEPSDRKKTSWGYLNSLNAVRDAGPFFGAGIQLAAAVVLMFFLGRWLDSQFETSPWLMLVGIVFGVGAGLYNFIRTVQRVEKRETEKK